MSVYRREFPTIWNGNEKEISKLSDARENRETSRMKRTADIQISSFLDYHSKHERRMASKNPKLSE